MNRVKYLLIVFAFSVLLVFGLFKLSENLNNRPGSFVRLFDPHKWLYYKSTDLRYNSYYLAGMTNDHVYLGTSTAQALLLKVTNRGDTQTLRIHTKNDIEWDTSGWRYLVDSSRFYLYNGARRQVITGSLTGLKEEQRDTTSTFFYGFMAVRPGQYILRVLNDSLQQYVLITEGMGSNNICVPDKQQDGIFSIDGSLDLDRSNNTFTYTYYYRNSCIVSDTGLFTKKYISTIDTNTIGKISIGTVSSAGVKTFTSPPLKVNKRSSIHRDTLYIYSGLRARNQEEDYFEHNATVDMYKVSTGKYITSFYLPDLFGSRMKSFKVYGRHLAALYDHHLAIYTLQ